TVAQYVPNIAKLIIHCQIITPLDLEQTYGLTGGHILHGEQLLDQLFVSWARYRTPMKGLYLCGAGTHPRSGMTGASGANAAREVIRDTQTLGGGPARRKSNGPTPKVCPPTVSRIAGLSAVIDRRYSGGVCYACDNSTRIEVCRRAWGG